MISNVIAPSQSIGYHIYILVQGEVARRGKRATSAQRQPPTIRVTNYKTCDTYNYLVKVHHHQYCFIPRCSVRHTKRCLIYTWTQYTHSQIDTSALTLRHYSLIHLSLCAAIVLLVCSSVVSRETRILRRDTRDRRKDGGASASDAEPHSAKAASKVSNICGKAGGEGIDWSYAFPITI